jgi:methylmalonyl-CoA/ethylmalonyl-CoA epimerase
MKLHHVGIVVKEIAAYGELYARLLGLTADSEVFHDPIQDVRVQFWRDERRSLLELIEPVGPDSPVWRDAQKGGGLNHLCYETTDIEHTVAESLQSGGMITKAIAPAVAFGGRRIVFLYFLELGLIEFVEADQNTL